MRPHFLIWILALSAVCGAALLIGLRGASRTQALATRQGEAQARIDLALNLLESDPSAAEAPTQDAIRTATVLAQESGLDTAESAYLRALQYQRERNLRGAETFFKRAIALQPEWSDPYSGLGWLLGVHALGRSEDAMAYVRQAIALDPTDSRPHIALAVLLRFEERYDEAEAAALEALRLDPESVPTHNNYANLLIRRQEYEKAEEHYLRAIDIDPESVKPYYNLACLYALTNRPEKSLEYLEKAVDLDPIYRSQALADPDLESLRNTPDFNQIVYRTPLSPESPPAVPLPDRPEG